MPTNVFHSSSNSSESRIDTPIFAQTPYLRPNYMESNIGEDIDLKSQ